MAENGKQVVIEEMVEKFKKEESEGKSLMNGKNNIGKQMFGDILKRKDAFDLDSLDKKVLTDLLKVTGLEYDDFRYKTHVGTYGQDIKLTELHKEELGLHGAVSLIVSINREIISMYIKVSAHACLNKDGVYKPSARVESLLVYFPISYIDKLASFIEDIRLIAEDTSLWSGIDELMALFNERKLYVVRDELVKFLEDKGIEYHWEEDVLKFEYDGVEMKACIHRRYGIDKIVTDYMVASEMSRRWLRFPNDVREGILDVLDALRRRDEHPIIDAGRDEYKLEAILENKINFYRKPA